MIHPIRSLVDVAIKVFALGLFVSIVLNWLNIRALSEVQYFLNRFYDVFLNPIRHYIRPVRFGSSAPLGLDLSPLILLALIWWLIHPFLTWVLS